jgi:signal transduction histidine kinase
MNRGLSVRWRLTLVYLAISGATAAVLLGGIYVLVSQSPRIGFSISGDLAEGGTVSEQAQPLPGSGDVAMRRVLVAARHDAVSSTLDDLLWWSLIGLVLTAAVSLAVGWYFAGRALAPVHTITSRARQISANSLDERVSLGGPHDELREMADTFDDLLDRVQQVFDSERRLVATMSHELRTPLANQQTALDVALADPNATTDDLRVAGEIALDQTLRANRTIEALLTLARVQSGVEAPRREPVDLAAVVSEVVEQIDHRDLEWHVELEPAVVPGDRELLRRAVANIVDNAAVHNVPEGRVDVHLTTSGDTTRLSVSNTGPHIAPEIVADLTLPFRRGAVDRTASDRGVGLGLSIVQAVADHQSGNLTLTPLAGGGLAATLSVPSRPDFRSVTVTSRLVTGAPRTSTSVVPAAGHVTLR